MQWLSRKSAGIDCRQLISKNPSRFREGKYFSYSIVRRIFSGAGHFPRNRLSCLFIEEIQVCSNIVSMYFRLLFLAVWLFVRRGCEHHLSLFFILRCAVFLSAHLPVLLLVCQPLLMWILMCPVVRFVLDRRVCPGRIQFIWQPTQAIPGAFLHCTSESPPSAPSGALLNLSFSWFD